MNDETVVRFQVGFALTELKNETEISTLVLFALNDLFFRINFGTARISDQFKIIAPIEPVF